MNEYGIIGTGRINVLGETLSHCQFVYHKSHMNQSVTTDETLAAERLSHGRASKEATFI